MAAPKKKKSKSKKRIGNLKKIKFLPLCINKETNELHIRHHITNKKYYKGLKIK